MSSRECEEIRDVLPEWTLGVLDGEAGAVVKEHLAHCPDCAGEETVLRTILAAKPDAPAGLDARIRARVREELGAGQSTGMPVSEPEVVPLFKRGRWAPTWALSAAAVVILSLGIGVVWNGEEVPEVGQDPIQVVAGEPLPEAWLWDDGMVAGAPVYDGLSDEQLEALIQELEG